MNKFIATLVFTIALTGAAFAQPYKSFNTSPSTDPGRVVFHTNPDVKFAVTDAVGDTGPVLNFTDFVTSSSVTLTVANTMQPTEPRELFIAQSDASGTSLRVTYTVTVQAWDGSIRPYVFTLTNDGTFAIPIPVIKIVGLSFTSVNGAASDKVCVGWRGFFVPGAAITATNQIITESVNGDVPATAGTLATDNLTPFGYAYIPNSITSGNTLALYVRSVGTQGITLGSPGLGQTGAPSYLGVDP